MREEETWEVGTKYEREKKLGRMELNMRGRSNLGGWN